MTRLLISTAFAGILALGGVALAQGDDHHDQHGGGGHPPAPHGAPPAPHPAAAPAPHPAAPQHSGFMGVPQNRPAAAPPSRPAPQNAMRGPGPNGPAPAMNMRGPSTARHGAAPTPNAAPNRGTAMRGPASGAPARNFATYNRNFNAPRRFHAPAYQRPAGWYSQRWTFGQILPRLFWAPNFWINDYVDFGLVPPPPGTVWVRDGDDALLIDQDSGEIIQVDYGVFY